MITKIYGDKHVAEFYYGNRKPALYITKEIRRRIEVKELRKQRHEQKLLERERRMKMLAKRKQYQDEQLNKTQQIALKNTKKDNQKTLFTVLIWLGIIAALALGLSLLVR